ncbi:hypothetical protein CKA32_003264 [Geitlerinema sp. FC II]|nr:hypothetical protein CKA32_003264 [Geitlerinema sp. FC II]
MLGVDLQAIDLGDPASQRFRDLQLYRSRWADPVSQERGSRSKKTRHPHRYVRHSTNALRGSETRSTVLHQHQ